VNRRLEEAGSGRTYRNLIGVTLGTGFGGGAVIDGSLLLGDNGTGGDLWCLPDSIEQGCIAEESVSIRAVKRVYKTLSGDDRELTPYDIFRIAEGEADGDAESARASFARLGKAAGATLATAATLIDGIIAIGGGVAGAAKYIIPALVDEMNSDIAMLDGTRLGRMQTRVYNLDDPEQFAIFAADDTEMISVPGSSRTVPYRRAKKTGVALSRMGAPAAISMGAYQFAINKLRN
ncbi:MAG: ROK family protein, partial [Muribaculaceae bacterium]|nr:ROK family protein [Muribaculaceae bacterium]